MKTFIRKASQAWAQAAQGAKHFVNDTQAATAVEYGLIAALVAVVIVSGIKLIGNNLETTFQSIGKTIH